MRVAMSSKAMQNDGVGKLPEYGAIFMSNSMTKKMCLQQKLFALPSAHSHFVKHVKVGMILFLFEYERRELHGVFEAISDGGIDIDPHALVKSGKHYPAQVKFKSLWVCNPLTEHEFGDAIKENYFTGKRFSFGLSETQVQKLLYLFSTKVIRVPERQLAKNGKAKLVVQSMEEVRQVDGRRKSNIHDMLNGGHAFGYNSMDIDPREATITRYSLMDNVERDHSKYQIAEVERAPNDGGFVMNYEFQDKCNQVNSFELRSFASTAYPPMDKVEQTNRKLLISGRERTDYCPITQPPSSIATEFSMYSCGDVQRARREGGLVENYDFQNVCNKDNGFEPPDQSKNSSMHQSTFCESSFVGVANSPVPDQTITKPPSWAHHQMESQLLSDLSSKASYRDAVIMSTHPSDSIVPSFPNYQYLSSNEVIFPSTIEGYRPNYGCSENVISASMQQPSLSYPSRNEPKGGNGTSFSGPSHIENAYSGAVMGLSQRPCSQNLDADSIKNQFYNRLSSTKFSLADIPSQRAGINGNDNMFSEDAINTNMYPSSLDNHGYQIEPEDQLRFEAAQRKEIRKSFMGNRSSEFEDPFTFEGYVSYDPQCPQHYEHNSFEYDPEHYRLPDAYYSGSHKKRTSVFSRLASASDGYPTERKATVSYMVGDMRTSVNGIVKMLHKSHQQWVKPKKLLVNRKEDDDKPKVKNRTPAFCGADVVLLKSPSKDIKLDCSLAGLDRIVDCSLAGMEKAIQSTEERFLNFKRRSDKKKLHSNGITTFSDASSSLESVLGGQQRKRKLVRPNFSKNDSSDNSDMQNCTSNLQAPVKEVPFISDKAGGCEASLGKQDNEKTEVSVNQPDQEDGVFDTKRRETRQRRIKPLGAGAKAGNESSINDDGVESATISGKCEGKIPDTLKGADCCDSTAEGSLHNCGIPIDSLMQVSEVGLPKGGAENANRFGAVEYERKNKADLPPSALSINEICINSFVCASTDKTNSSSDKVPEMQMEGKERTATSEDTSHVPATKHSEDTFKMQKLPLESAEKRRKLKR